MVTRAGLEPKCPVQNTEVIDFKNSNNRENRTFPGSEVHARYTDGGEKRRPGRPRRPVDSAEVVRLRAEGQSWPAIARRMRLGVGTVFRAYHAFENRAEAFQNPVAANLANPKTNPTEE